MKFITIFCNILSCCAQTQYVCVCAPTHCVCIRKIAWNPHRICCTVLCILEIDAKRMNRSKAHCIEKKSRERDGMEKGDCDRIEFCSSQKYAMGTLPPSKRKTEKRQEVAQKKIHSQRKEFAVHTHCHYGANYVYILYTNVVPNSFYSIYMSAQKPKSENEQKKAGGATFWWKSFIFVSESKKRTQ